MFRNLDTEVYGQCDYSGSTGQLGHAGHAEHVKSCRSDLNIRYRQMTKLIEAECQLFLEVKTSIKSCPRNTIHSGHLFDIGHSGHLFDKGHTYYVTIHVIWVIQVMEVIWVMQVIQVMDFPYDSDNCTLGRLLSKIQVVLATITYPCHAGDAGNTGLTMHGGQVGHTDHYVPNDAISI